MNLFRRFMPAVAICAALIAFLLATDGRAMVLLGSTDYNGPGNGYDSANALVLDANGNVYVAGSEVGALGDFNWRIRKYDATLGTLLATTDYNGPGITSTVMNDAARAIAIDGSGNVLVAGYEDGTSGNWRIRKYDATLGTLLATTDYNGPGATGLGNNDGACSIAIDGSGNIYVAGYEVSPTWYDWRIRKYDATLGTLLATTGYSTPSVTDDVAYSIAVDASGNVFVAGYERPFGGSCNWRIRKYDATLGTLLATTDYDDQGNWFDDAYSIAIDSGGNVLVAGTEVNIVGGQNWLIRKYDATLGILLAATGYNGPGNDFDEAYSIAIDGSGNVVVAGYETNAAGWQDWGVRKYDATLGTLLWATVYDDPIGHQDQANAVAIDPIGNIYVAGYDSGTVGGVNWRVQKYGMAVSPGRVTVPPGLPIVVPLRVYPNPFNRASAVGGMVRFEGLAPGGKVRIYSPAGLRVWEGTVTLPNLLMWNGRNEASRAVAPGTYLWVAEGSGVSRRGRLIVE